jgi:xanthine dehydrogenase accessory factor
LGGIDADTSVACLTHAPELDDEALMIALRSPAPYIAALGSRRSQARRRERLAAAGLGEAELARLSGPAGLDLGGVTAAEAALAILAEAVAARYGREGGRLTNSPNQIHASA